MSIIEKDVLIHIPGFGIDDVCWIGSGCFGGAIDDTGMGLTSA